MTPATAQGAPPPPAATAVAARALALDLLDCVFGRRRPLDEALESHPDAGRLDRRDRAFALNLAVTSIRRVGQIDALIAHCLARALPEKAAAVRHLLRLGVCQLVFLRTPPHAAVDTTVALARRRGHAAHAGLINAVLRRLAREGPALAAAQDAARLNTPDWLWRSWTETYGEDLCRRIGEAHLREPPLDLTVNGTRAPADLAARLAGTVLPTGTVRVDRRGPVTALPGFDSGAWWVQDAAAALPARLLGDVRGSTVVDLCAAPGGKTAQLAAAGALVTAVDRTPERVARLQGNLARLGLDAATVVADAAGWRPSQPADAVLLDVPCSATGTIRRHPDVAWLKTAADAASLAAAQDRLLAAAVEMVRPGGLLVYAACSLQPEEGPARIAARLAADPRIRRVPVAAPEIGGLAELLDGNGDLRSLPCHLADQGGVDGFYAARLRRL
ncbi:MAG: RsmB/NOP family class I SAM-dependent RNA methyltransferase [Rhodospirillales bacterium]